jgi:hypothetical protein
VIGFARSVWLRLAVGMAFCCGAVGMVCLVERSPAEPVAQRQLVSPEMAAPALRLAVESSFPVSGWQVQVLGIVQQAESSDPYRWHGTVRVPAGEEVLVQAQADARTAVPHHALRLRLGDASERLVWGTGDMAVALAAP